MMEDHALVLVSLNPDMSDVAGNIYPSHGFVEAKDYNSDKSVLSGLVGIMWGRIGSSAYLKIDPSVVWVVLKIDLKNPHVNLDDHVIKFKGGLVVFVGNIHKAASYIVLYKEKHFQCGQCFPSSEIAGFIDNADTPNKHAVAHGCSGRAISNIPSLHAICTNRDGQAITTNLEAHAISLGSKGKALTVEDSCLSVALEGDSSAYAVGTGSKAVACQSFSSAIATGVNSTAVCLEEHGEASAGPDGILIMAYIKDDQKRFAIGYVGEGIMPNRMYRCEEGKFVCLASN
tara:strand:- start:784 stop:1644 length:861 start_codon:yes stop_codon:yes gene_type:complete